MDLLDDENIHIDQDVGSILFDAMFSKASELLLEGKKIMRHSKRK